MVLEKIQYGHIWTQQGSGWLYHTSETQYFMNLQAEARSRSCRSQRVCNCTQTSWKTPRLHICRRLRATPRRLRATPREEKRREEKRREEKKREEKRREEKRREEKRREEERREEKRREEKKSHPGRILGEALGTGTSPWGATFCFLIEGQKCRPPKTNFLTVRVWFYF